MNKLTNLYSYIAKINLKKRRYCLQFCFFLHLKWEYPLKNCIFVKPNLRPTCLYNLLVSGLTGVVFLN